MSVNQPTPGASDALDKLIVRLHAKGQTLLDRYGIPREADGIMYTIAERIELLAGSPPPPREIEPSGYLPPRAAGETP